MESPFAMALRKPLPAVQGLAPAGRPVARSTSRERSAARLPTPPERPQSQRTSQEGGAFACRALEVC